MGRLIALLFGEGCTKVVRIIHKGKNPADKEYRLRCNVCTTVLVAKKSELEYHSDYRESSYSITCPVCRKKIYVSARNLDEMEEKNGHETLDPSTNR